MKISFTHDLAALAVVLKEHHCKNDVVGVVLRDMEIDVTVNHYDQEVKVTFTEKSSKPPEKKP